MIRGFLALAGCLAVLAVACGSGDADESADSTATIVAESTAEASCSPAKPAETGDSTRTILSGGLERTYTLHLPPGYDGNTAAPVVVAFHGESQTATSMSEMSALDAAADTRGMIVAYVAATGDGLTWNLDQLAGAPDDVAFTEALLEELQVSLCIDPERVYATGYSSGGGMALKLGCDLAERFAAVSPVAGIFSSCAVPVPLIAFHGTADPVVPFEGGPVPSQPAVAFPPVRRAVSESARSLGCDGLPVITRPGTEIEISMFVNCPAGDGETMLYAILGGGHTWPGSPVAPDSAVVGVTTQQIDASALMLDFFLAHPLAR